MQASVFEPMDRTVAETVLKETKHVLDQLGIVFFLRHGTCLGAVRDDSLITWDDDLDVGSVIGLRGLTEERMYEAVDLFSQEGFDPNVIVSEIGLEVEMRKYDVPIDWNCYRIIGDNIYQWPVVQISLSLHTELKEIKFLGETFLVPNPPEDYLRQRYGPDWGIPKKIGTFESDVLEMTDHSFIPPDHKKTMSLGSRYVSSLHTGYLKVFDLEGLPYVDAVADLFHYGHTNFFQKAREVVFQLVIARTQFQDQPARADLVHRVRHLRQQGRIPPAHREHQGSQFHPSGNGRQSREKWPRLPDAPGLLFSFQSVEQVIDHPQ